MDHLFLMKQVFAEAKVESLLNHSPNPFPTGNPFFPKGFIIVYVWAIGSMKSCKDRNDHFEIKKPGLSIRALPPSVQLPSFLYLETFLGCSFKIQRQDRDDSQTI
jgi:hypothetical protein